MDFLKKLFTPELISVALKKVLPVILVNKLIFFVIYKKTKNPCVVDVGYTVGHFLAGAVYASQIGNLSSLDSRIKLFILGAWCLRLAGFLTTNRVMKQYHDPRYEIIFKKHPVGSFKREAAVFGQYMFQGLIVLVTSSPLFWMFKNVQPWSLASFKGVGCLNYIGLFLAVAGIILEGVAGKKLIQLELIDQQLQNYKNDKQQYKSGSIFREGLWKNSRHPNLFFELLTWFSFGLSGIKGIWDVGSFVGPFVLYNVMDKLTVPLTESYLKKSRGDKYVDYIKDTNKYWPF